MLTFISCIANENVSEDEEYPIEVEAHIDSYYTNSHASRAVKLTAASLQSFGVYSYYNGSARVRDATFTKSGTAWKSNKAMTWAAGAMDFCAVSPSFSIASTAANRTMLSTPRNFTYVVPTNVANQVDIMYANTIGLSRGDNNGKINFAFAPAMHYINFTAKNSIGTDYKVVIDTIIVHNIVCNGQFEYSSAKSNTGDWVLSSTPVYVNDTIVLASPVELKSTNTALMNNEYMIIIPQKTTMWRTSKTNPKPIANADADHNYYVETKAQIIKIDGTNQTYLLGNVDQSDPNHTMYESVYFPLAAKTFRKGAGSTLTIDFNGGYNEQGLPYLENTDRGDGVEVEVSEWMDFDFEIEEWIPIYEDLIF
jgi:hypothetical protein